MEGEAYRSVASSSRLMSFYFFSCCCCVLLVRLVCLLLLPLLRLPYRFSCGHTHTRTHTQATLLLCCSTARGIFVHVTVHDSLTNGRALPLSRSLAALSLRCSHDCLSFSRSVTSFSQSFVRSFVLSLDSL